MGTFTNAEIGEEVREARIAVGASQQELADLMRKRGFEWSQATVWSVEKGKRALRLNEAVALSEMLNVRFVEVRAGNQRPRIILPQKLREVVIREFEELVGQALPDHEWVEVRTDTPCFEASNGHFVGVDPETGDIAVSTGHRIESETVEVLREYFNALRPESVAS